jgi:phosphoribosyl 1,2-cyclic phosphate phosphodiesterase
VSEASTDNPAGILHVTVLGSGTSMGVPSLGCHCRVCESADPRDNRTRPSLLVSRGTSHVVIDTTPDFRFQALRARMDRLDAVVYTHGHADHILGLDDIRPYTMRQCAPMPVYASEETLATLRKAFDYVFNGAPAISEIPRVATHVIEGPFELLGARWTPVPAEHGHMPVLGFRIGGMAYLTDFSRVPDASKPLLTGADDLILDALRDTPHPMHLTVAQALELVAELKPRRAWFTHIAHDLPHQETNERLARAGFPHAQLSYDGLSFEVRE